MAEENLEVQEQRRKKQRRYDKESYKRHKKQAADAMPAGPAKVAAQQVALKYQPALNSAVPTPWHAKPALALDEICCKPVTHGFPHWDCVLRCCAKCPSYPVPPEEQGTDENAPNINFHVYQTVTECSKHGVITPGAKKCPQCEAEPEETKSKTTKLPKVRSRKHLTLLTRPIGKFLNDYYLPGLEKLAYHRPHCRILGKDHCGATELASPRLQASPECAHAPRLR